MSEQQRHVFDELANCVNCGYAHVGFDTAMYDTPCPGVWVAGRPKPEPKRPLNSAERLSKMLWDARELCDMYGDIVAQPSMSHLTNHDRLGRNWAHRTRDEIDAYRAEKGWSPNGFGGEATSDLQADLVEAVAQREKLRTAATAVITAWNESTSFQPCEECMKSGVALWPYQSEEAVNDAVEVLRNLIEGEKE